MNQQTEWFYVVLFALLLVGLGFPGSYGATKLEFVKKDVRWKKVLYPAFSFLCDFIVYPLAGCGVLLIFVGSYNLIFGSISANYSSIAAWWAFTVLVLIGAALTPTMFMLGGAVARTKKNDRRKDWLYIPLCIAVSCLYLFLLVPLCVWYWQTCREGRKAGVDLRQRRRIYKKWTGVKGGFTEESQIYYLSPSSELRIVDFITFVKFQESAPADDQPIHWIVVEQNFFDKSMELITRKHHESSWKGYGTPNNWYGDGKYRISMQDGEGLCKTFEISVTQLGFTDVDFNELIKNMLVYLSHGFNNLRHEYDRIIREQVAPLLAKGYGGNNPQAQAAKMFCEAGPAILSDKEMDFRIEELLEQQAV